MTWVAVAVGGAAVVGAGVGIYASNQSAGAVEDASSRSTNTQLRMYEEGRQDTAPWRIAGEKALNTLTEKINAGPGEYTQSPGYEFRLNEGKKAIQNAASAKGSVLSPSTSKALTRYAQDYATGDYQNWLANYYQSLTPLQSMAGLGLTTASQAAAQGNNVAANIGANQLASGYATGAGVINAANSITGNVNSGINNYLAYSQLYKNNNNPVDYSDSNVANQEVIY